MLLSRFFLPTLKETPADAELVSHRYMLRAGLIRKLASGLYSWLPLGLRVLRKVERIVRDEMVAAGAQELLMPMVQPAELWQESGRWEKYDKELLRLKDRHDRDFCLGPTHEEVIVDIVRNELNSYKQLPVTLYQIQTKFRDEIRPRFGVMRAREFIMKDAYSFHTDAESMKATYAVMYQAYTNIFTRLGLNFRAVAADSGNIGGDMSHEFQVIADAGEDVIAYSDTSDYAANIEVKDLANVAEGDPSPDGKGHLKFARGIEVGHIFQLGDLYCKSLNMNVLSEEGKAMHPLMGCYGIGISRVVAAAIEQNHDDNGIVWPEPMAPFTVAIIPIQMHKSYRVREFAENLYQQLLDAGVEVVLDDRKERPGVMFATMDLIGIPHQVIIGERGLDEGIVEYKNRRSPELARVAVAEILAKLRSF